MNVDLTQEQIDYLKLVLLADNAQHTDNINRECRLTGEIELAMERAEQAATNRPIPQEVLAAMTKLAYMGKFPKKC